MNSVSAKRASGSIHCAWQRKPARRRRSRRSRRRRTCRSSRSRSLSPAAKATSHSARGIRTVCARRETRCISTRRSAAFQTARCAKAVEVEVGEQLRVHAREQVLVEGGGHAERIVVGEQQVALGLDEVGAEQQRVARAQGPADLREELARGGRIEVADVRAEEEDEHRAAVGPVARGVAQPLLVGRAVADDRDVLEAPERALGELERRRRDVDQVDRAPGAAAARSASAIIASFSPLPQPSSTSVTGSPTRRHHLRREPREQAPLGARDPVPRQVADRLEERRAEPVVEVLRLELLGREGEVAAHVGRRNRARLRRAGTARSAGSPSTRPSGTSRTRTGSSAGTSCASCAARAPSGRRGRGALHDVVLPVEEVRRVLRDRTASDGSPRSRAKTVDVHSHPLPTRSRTPHALVAAREGADGDRIPPREVEVAARRVRRRVAPRVPRSVPDGRPERRAVVLGFRRQPPALPARVRRRLRVRDVDRPRHRQREQLPHAAPEPGAAVQLPEERMPHVVRPTATASPPRSQRPSSRVAARLDELQVVAVGDAVASIENACTSTRCAGNSLSHANGISSRRRRRASRVRPGCGRLRGSGGSTPVQGAGTSGGRRSSGRRAAGARCSAASPGASARARAS